MAETPSRDVEISPSSLVSDGRKSRSRGLAALLKEVYQFHVETIAGLETKIEELQKKCSKLERVKTELLHKGHDLQGRHDDLLSAHQRVKEDLATANIRLQVPCEVCQVLRSQLEQQGRLYTMVVGAMKRGKTHTQRDSALSQLSALTEISQLTESKPNPAQSETPAIHSNRSHKENNPQPGNHGDNQSQDLLQKTSQHAKSDQSEEPTQKPSRHAKSDQSQEPTQKPSRHAKSDQSEELTQKPGSQSQAMDYAEEDISPGTGKSRSLKLARNSKRSRCKYKEESLPDSKKPKRATNQSQSERPPRDTSPWQQAGRSPDILAPQTCDIDGGPPGGGAGGRGRRDQRPDIVVPETVPFDLGDDDDDPVRVQEDDLATTGDQQTVIQRSLSPPSHASTPLPSGGGRTHRNNESTASSPWSAPRPSVVTMETSPRGDSVTSEPASPVFCHPSGLQREAAKSIRSPSLYGDSDDGGDDGDDSHQHSASKKLFCAEHLDTDASPSVLSGHRILKTTPASSRSPASRSPARRRLVQLRLSSSGQTKARKSFDPDETVDIPARRAEEEQRMLQRATQESLEQFQLELAAREISFAEPKFTSTQRSAKRSPFKVPKPPPRRDPNGTIDPHLRLSQFMTQPDEATFLEPVGIGSIAEGKYRYSDSEQPPKDSEEMPEPSAKSVVFGKKKLPKASSSGVKESEGKGQRSRTVTDEHADCQEETHGGDHDDLSADYHDDSFDRLPTKAGGPGFAFVEVVRKQDERRKLDAHACRECQQYYDGLGLSEEEKRSRMASCRHRARFARPDTPEHFWSLDFPDTQEIEDRGYMNTTQAKPSRFRRKRGLRPLFLETEEGGDKDAT